MILNRVLLNIINVNQIHLNKIGGFGKAKGGVIPPQPDPAYPAGCIHRSKNYGRSNDDADRDIIKDLSGTGTDIILYNFGYALGSGFGKYGEDFNRFQNYLIGEDNLKKTSNKLIVHGAINNTCWLAYLPNQSTTNNFKIKVSGIDGDIELYYRYILNGARVDVKLNNGIFDCPASEAGNDWVGIGCRKSSSGFTIEQIPDYKGALVSDGVDDYGLCENFPLLNKDKGFTIFAIRKWITESNAYFIHLATRSSYDNTFEFEYNPTDNSYSYSSYGGSVSNAINNSLFSYMTSVKANGVSVVVGSRNPSNLLTVFSNNNKNHYSNIALYALEIYDRDLTDEEIAAVKARMIREYEEGTGLPYDEKRVLLADYEAYDKSNDDEDRDTC